MCLRWDALTFQGQLALPESIRGALWGGVGSGPRVFCRFDLSACWLSLLSLTPVTGVLEELTVIMHVGEILLMHVMLNVSENWWKLIFFWLCTLVFITNLIENMLL